MGNTAGSFWLLWPAPQALIGCYGPHHRLRNTLLLADMAHTAGRGTRSNWLLWPTPQAEALELRLSEAEERGLDHGLQRRVKAAKEEQHRAVAAHRASDYSSTLPSLFGYLYAPSFFSNSHPPFLVTRTLLF